MFKKILEKLGFFKKKDYEFKEDDSQYKDNLKEEKKKDKKDSNTPDDIYPLW